MIGLSIIFHEFGHFSACKIFSIRTPAFSLGFGPVLAQKKIGDTNFRISLLPLGGYVEMDARQLSHAPYWQKMIIIVAGVFNNFLLGFLLLLIFFIFASSASYKYEEQMQFMHGKSSIFRQTLTTFWSLTTQTLYFITTFFRPEVRSSLLNPLNLGSDMFMQGLRKFIFFNASLNIQLGVFNILPIPMLDGGQAFYYTLGVIMKPFIGYQDQKIIHFIYLLLLILLLFYLNRKAKQVANHNRQI